ncbi:MAG: hypothetical protein ACLGSD_03920 [Acidobacteriota bacterium]
MRAEPGRILSRLLMVVALAFGPALAFAQGAGGAGRSAELVDAPAPQQDAPVQQTQHEKAAEQIRQEEKQRILGVVPNFGTTYVSNAASLTAGQKMQLAFRSAIDPGTFAIAALVGGTHELGDEDKGFGWGAAGYGKRAGAAYLDAFDGSMIGGGILPVIFHQDPRYFRLGHGSAKHRVLYALASPFICKHDRTGRWETNYSNIAGNTIAGAISNLYYPSAGAGVGQTITNGMVVTAEGGVGSVFVEFWPDLSRKLFHKDPTDGQDARMRAQDWAEKAARKKKQPLGAGPK